MSQVHAILRSLEEIVSRSGFRGYDPYDALNSPPLLALARRNRWAGVAFTQALRLLPVNPRPALGIREHGNAKTVSLLARYYLLRYSLSRQDHYRQQGLAALDWLDRHRSPGFAHACWGYGFPWCTVRQFLDRDYPSIVCTAFVAHAFLDGFEILGDRRYLEMARSACDFVLHDIPRIPGERGYCFSYTPLKPLPVHNANLLGVSLLGRVYRHTGERELLETALPAVTYTLDDQNEDGSWYYHGPYAGRSGMIDNFHTGFNLEALRRFRADTGHDAGPAVEAGQRFYERCLFDPDGTPWRKIGKQYPVDIRDPAQFLVAIGRMERPTAEQRRQAERVLQWTLRHMQAPSGYFHFLRWKRFARSPLYLRWQAWMLWGLANIVPLMQEEKETALARLG